MAVGEEQFFGTDCIRRRVDADPAMVRKEDADGDSVFEGAELFKLLTLLQRAG